MTETHKTEGTGYGRDAVDLYRSARHGPDGDKFLDPFFIPYLHNLAGQVVLDIGGGHGPWSIHAAENGAKRVLMFDYQKEMVEGARDAVQRDGLDNQIAVYVADAAAIPHPDESIDLTLSINVGCNLPNPTIVKRRMNFSEVGFEAHFREMARVLKVGGRGIITAPNSFGETFTSGRTSKEDVLRDIELHLASIHNPNDPATIKQSLTDIPNVYRATFAIRDGNIVLITDESTLAPGEMIWRKIPGPVIPNFYHGKSEYESAIQRAGLQIISAVEPRFETENKRSAHNDSVPEDRVLGEEYIKSAPFVIFIVQK